MGFKSPGFRNRDFAAKICLIISLFCKNFLSSGIPLCEAIFLMAPGSSCTAKIGEK